MDERFRWFVAGEFYSQINQRLQADEMKVKISEELKTSVKRADAMQILAWLNYALDCYNIPALTWQEFCELQQFKAAKEDDLFRLYNR